MLSTPSPSPGSTDSQTAACPPSPGTSISPGLAQLLPSPTQHSPSPGMCWPPSRRHTSPCAWDAQRLPVPLGKHPPHQGWEWGPGFCLGWGNMMSALGSTVEEAGQSVGAAHNQLLWAESVRQLSINPPHTAQPGCPEMPIITLGNTAPQSTPWPQHPTSNVHPADES